MDHYNLLKYVPFIIFIAAVAANDSLKAVEAKSSRVNVLLITADDMNYNTPGFTGNRMVGITPHLDKLASQGIWICNAHVTAAICQPSREALMTGRYPHRNGAPGFDPIARNVPTLQEQLRTAGYVNGILGKVEHLQPQDKFCWDFVDNDLGNGRDPARYYLQTKKFIENAKVQGKPFFLMANSRDPHRPFSGSDQERDKFGDGHHPYPAPRLIYKPSDVFIPGFLLDLPDIRRELGEYYSSAHRADQTVGEILRALAESGLEENTMVMFLSDNGMSFPFAKTNCYFTSTRTPWLVRWPGKIQPGAVDSEHFISGIDYMPTILEAAGLPLVAGMDGKSFLPLLLGEKQSNRESVMTVINTTSAHKAFPMRCLQDKRFGYIFNAWSDGDTVFKNEPQSGRTWKAMVAAANADPAIAERTRLFQYRVAEEFYDFQNDPDALHNLIADPRYFPEIERMRGQLQKIMTETNDPVLEKFHKRATATPGSSAASRSITPLAKPTMAQTTQP